MTMWVMYLEFRGFSRGMWDLGRADDVCVQVEKANILGSSCDGVQIWVEGDISIEGGIICGVLCDQETWNGFVK